MFEKARLKLTAWYLLIIMAVSITFSIVIYRFLMQEVLRFERVQRFRIERRVEYFVTPIPANVELIDEIRQRIIVRLGLVNTWILILSGGLGYFLAGRTLKPIREMIDEQNRFISDASHELRTPLTSLKSAMEVHLRDKKLNLKDARKLIEENIEDVNKLESLSDSLLELAQYQKPKFKLDLTRINLKSAVSKAVDRVEKIAARKNIRIQNNAREFAIEASEDQLTDLFVILLDNAIKYSPEKKPIEIVSGKTDGQVWISVRDRGPGISRKDLPFIFDRFYRSVEDRSKIKVDGYGLGLSIGQKIAQLHHGKLTVQSTPGKGSVFTVFLPVKQKKLINS